MNGKDWDTPVSYAGDADPDLVSPKHVVHESQIGDNDAPEEGRYVRLRVGKNVQAALWGVQVFGYECEGEEAAGKPR